MSYLIAFSYCPWGSQGRNTEVVCHFLLQWTIFCQNFLNLVFQICWHIECSTFTASSFRILNSSAGIPSLPLALFIVMLPKAHLTSYSRISGSRSVTTPSGLSGSLRSFLHNSSMYFSHLFLISSASVRSLLFLSFIVHVLA